MVRRDCLAALQFYGGSGHELADNVHEQRRGRLSRRYVPGAGGGGGIRTESAAVWRFRITLERSVDARDQLCRLLDQHRREPFRQRQLAPGRDGGRRTSRQALV